VHLDDLAAAVSVANMVSSNDDAITHVCVHAAPAPDSSE
jgi:hypothetical protein